MMYLQRMTGAVLLLLAAAAPVAGQSLFSTRGLGVPVAPVDARAAALGGTGVGLLGFHTSLTNPAELAGLSRRGVSAALQPTSTSVEVENAEANVSASRFPLMTFIYPVSRRLVASLGYGGYLEQSYGIIVEGTETIGDSIVAVTDILRSTGGISQLRLNGAYAVTPTLALGFGAGLLTGNVQRSATRVFNDSATTLLSFQKDQRWHYSAPVASIGARWDIAGRLRLAGSAMIGGNLSATGEDDAESREYGAPLELAAGASTRSGLLLATAGVVWSRMPTTTGTTESRETLRLGGGVEYQGLRSGQRTYPLRVGARWAQLPYHATGEDPASEWSVGGGIGFRLGDPTDPAAVADIGIDRGARSGLGGGAVSGVEERIWRFTLSLSLFAR